MRGSCCTRCGVEKPASSFSPGKRSDGLQSRCKECVAAVTRDRRKADPVKTAAERLKFRIENPGYWREHYAKNATAESERKAAFYRENTEVAKTRIKAYHERNPHVRTSITAKRRATLERAVPLWADMEAVKRVYKEAAQKTAATGVPHEVDHIVPLQGKTVCGLHCEANLRVLPKVDNRRKSNKLEAECC